MAKVMDQPLSEEASSDNEEINKLFPRCRPRNMVQMCNDFNQNNVNINNNLKDHRKLSTASSDSTMSSSIMDKANDNYLPHNNNNQDHSEVRPSSDMSESSSCCGGEQQPPPPPPAEITEDHSVISAYDYCDYENSGLLCNTTAASNNKEEARSNSTSSMTCDRRDYGEDVVYDPDLDVGFHMDPGFCLRESRIEIAGGREIFSKSRSKPSKKRHSEEVMYHRQRVSHDHNQVATCNNSASSKSQDFKRFSADVMYDDKLRRYMYNMCSGSVDKLHTCSKYRTESSYIVEEKSPEHMPRMNGRMCLRKSSSVRGLQDLHSDSKQHTGHLVYEAPVSNAEVVYDDIGELIDQRKSENYNASSSFAGNGTSNGLHVKTSVSETDYSTYPGEILESPNSDTDQSFRIMHKPYIGTLDVSSPVSPCGGLWGVDAVGQENVGSLQNLSQEEEMDTDSEPASPVKQGIARLIGNVPIAEYEGSPRRYGPRPGYPHRISSETVEQNGGEKTHPSTCEELLKVIAGNKSIVSDSRKNNGQCKSSDELVDCNSHESDIKNILKEFGSSSFSKGESKDSSNKGISSAQDSDFSELEYRLYRVNTGSSYVGRRLAQSSGDDNQDSPKRNDIVKLVNGDVPHIAKSSLAINECLTPSHDSGHPTPPSPPPPEDSAGNPSAASVFLPNEQELMLLHESVHQHTLQVEMVDQDLESISTYPGTEDLGETEVGEQVDHTRNFTLSPETTDCDSNDVESVVSLEGSMNSGGRLMSSMPVLEDGLSSGHSSDPDTSDDERSEGGWSENRKRSSEEFENPTLALINKQISKIEQDFCKRPSTTNTVPPEKMNHHDVAEYLWRHSCNTQHLTLQDVDLSYFDVLSQKPGETSPRDNGLPDECPNGKAGGSANVSEAIKEIKQAIQMSKNVQLKSTLSGNNCDGPNQPVWVPRLSQSGKTKEGCHPDAHGERNVDDEDCDTDQETDRLLGAQRTDDKGFYDDKSRNSSGKKKSTSKEVLIHEPAVLIEGVLFRARYLGSTQLVCEGQPTKATRMMQAEEAVSRIKHNPARMQLTGKTDVSTSKGDPDEPFSGTDTYTTPNDVDDRVEQMKISLCPHAAPEGETQPSTEVDLFISTEKIMVLNTDLKEIMMDHALRAISYIADIGDLVVLMARRRVMNSPDDPNEPKIKRTPKMICHVFESEEAQFIAQSIGQAFQVAYMEFLKANGIEDSSFVKEMDYQEVLNSQEIFGNELEMFAKKEKQKERLQSIIIQNVSAGSNDCLLEINVVVPKQKGEILGMVIVESGWGSMLPTVVIANMAQSGPAARCGQLNIGDQIIAINGISLVGLPLSTCQNYIKNTKNQTVVKLTVVPCAPVVEVKIKRPDTKYQLGFSVQNGVICSLLRGGIAERGGVRVGHRIIEINGQSVVAVPHEKIVNLLATSVGEIHMKTMPTSMFRLLTGQESPLYI